MASTLTAGYRDACDILTRLRRIQELVPAQPVEEEPQERVRTTSPMTPETPAHAPMDLP
jgi:hypothetical protein